jgi:hypothetical protein
MSEQIEQVKRLLIEKQMEILKVLDGVSYQNCQQILSSVKSEIENISFVKIDNQQRGGIEYYLSTGEALFSQKP